MDDVLRMQVADCEADLRGIESSFILRKSAFLEEMFVQLASTQELDHKVQSQIILEHELHAC